MVLIIKKKKSTIFFLCLFCLICCLFSCERSQYNNLILSPNEKAVNELLSQLANKFERQYKIKPVATNVAMHGGIVRMLGLDFQVIGPLTKEDIRRLLIKLVQEFLITVNTDEKIRTFLKKYPFTIKNISITLFIDYANGQYVLDPEIGIAGISTAELNYKYLDIDPETYINFKKVDQETYEEALDMLENIQNK